MLSAALLVVPLISAAAATKPIDLAAGALSYVASRRCEQLSSAGNTTTIEWPAETYGGGRRQWGPKAFNTCNGGVQVYTEAVMAGAYWSQGDHEVIASNSATFFDAATIRAAFKQLFAWEPPEHNPEAPGFAGNTFNKYDAKKIKALFDRYYMKPTDMFGQIPAQAVYDVAFKRWVTRLANEIATVKGKVPKSKWPKLFKEYQAAAKANGTAFKGQEFLKQLAQNVAEEDPAMEGAGRALGIILRRNADGTWPTVAGLLKKVIADYDPELAKEVGASLK
jgi:hypothetical protein